MDEPTATDWNAERARLRDGDLDASALARLALACYLLGDADEAVDCWHRAFDGFRAQSRTADAARSAFWAAYACATAARPAQAGAWASRIEELAASSADAAVTALAALARALNRGDDAAELLDHARDAATRAADDDTLVLATLERAHLLVRTGQPGAGFALMDDVMLRTRTGELSPPVAGAAYCGVIASCFGRCDLERAAEWTTALTHWCESQRGLVPFRGMCLVHEARLLHLQGRWDAAAALAADALEYPAAGIADPDAAAHRLLGDIERGRGRRETALAHYRAVARTGGEPQPGLALIRADEGETAQAVAALERVLSSQPDPDLALSVLDALVTIRLALAGDAAAEVAGLQEWASRLGTVYPRALAARARAAAALAVGDHASALSPLHEALDHWRTLRAAYEQARTRVLRGQACALAGDVDAAQADLEAARDAFATIGAVPDIRDAAERLSRVIRSSTAAGGPLSPREREVLLLVADGLSNRAIAQRLFLSERTVARHVGSILAKLGLANRAAATAYAYEHALVPPGHSTPPRA